jgi:hypothetical protein
MKAATEQSKLHLCDFRPERFMVCNGLEPHKQIVRSERQTQDPDENEWGHSNSPEEAQTWALIHVRHTLKQPDSKMYWK